METTEKSLEGTRILYAITKSNWGGAQAYVYELAKGAGEAGARVTVALGSADGKGGSHGLLAERLSEIGVPIIPLSQIKRDISFLDEVRGFWELVRIIRNVKPHVLHLNSSKMGLLGSLAGRLAGVPHIVFTAHGWPHREPRSRTWKAMIWFASWCTIVLSHKVIVVSECDLETSPVLRQKQKLVLIHNGISSFPLLSREDARAALAHHSASSSNLTHFDTWLLMNAELHTNKGIDIAIRALAQLAPTYPNLALVVAGEGQERGRLFALANSLAITDRVFLLGFVPNARQNLNAADIYLMPSRKEGLPMAILEAGIASLPVVASNVGGIPEIIEHQKTGLLVEPQKPKQLARAIESLLSNPQEARALGANLHSRIHVEFTNDSIINETFNAYRL